ncbi:hypothetical protein PS862_00823 [Pseudomonas fluorescens]|uniref:Uncharacterized protein n=1 Tax=Pseudomonas fluorescens TaxID=294 RepID=A0A5E7HAX0_PSEFL|nr:hypothetical protein [Pseudomonas fluorescens]VVO61125.1 hypothetical protein PS862_00823 [Pseudomonas fluorescens]
MTETNLILALQALDEAYVAFKKENEQLDQKIEQCLHAGGPWPTEADYRVWTDAADALRKAGQVHGEEVASSHGG